MYRICFLFFHLLLRMWTHSGQNEILCYVFLNKKESRHMRHMLHLLKLFCYSSMLGLHFSFSCFYGTILQLKLKYNKHKPLNLHYTKLTNKCSHQLLCSKRDMGRYKSSPFLFLLFSSLLLFSSSFCFAICSNAA